MIAEKVVEKQPHSLRDKLLLVLELQQSEGYSNDDVKLLVKSLGKENLDKKTVVGLIEKWKFEQEQGIGDYLTSAFTHLLKWSNALSDKDISEKPSKNLGQVLTGETLELVAESVIDPGGQNKGFLEQARAVDRRLLLKTVRGTKALFAYFIHLLPGSNESIQNVAEKAEELSDDEMSPESKKIIKEIFVDVIKNWWVRYVGRPGLVKGYDSNTYESLVQPNTGDKILQEKGYFTFGYEVNKETEFWDMAIRTAYLDLRQKVIYRRIEAEEMEKQGKSVTVSPLPLRPGDGYSVIFDSGDGKPIKVKIPLNLLEGGFNNFKGLVQSYIYFARLSEEDRDLLEYGLKERSGIVKPMTKLGYRLSKMKGEFRQLYQHQKLQADLADLSSPYAADLRISTQNLGAKTMLGAVQDNYAFDPMGGRIQTTYIFGFAGNRLKKVHTTNSHIFVDGAKAKAEQMSILQRALRGNPDRQLEVDGITTAQEMRAIQDTVEQAEFKALTEQELPKNKTYEEVGIAGITSAKEGDRDKKAETIVISLGKELYQTDNVIESMFETLDRKKKDGLYSFYKERFNVSLTPAVLLNLAITRALGLDHTHFLDLDKADNTLGPVISGLPPIFERVIQEKKYITPGFMTGTTLNKIVGTLQLFEEGRGMFRDDPKTFKQGRGVPEVLDVVAGIFKKPLSAVGRFLAGKENDMLQNTVLVSILLEEDRKKIDQNYKSIGVRLREFTTAMGLPYLEKGSIGVCQNTEGGLRVSYRRGKRNLVEEKFGAGPDAEMKFKSAITESINELLYVFNAVKEHVQHEETYSKTQTARAA